MCVNFTTYTLNHDAIHLKLIVMYGNEISIKLGKVNLKIHIKIKRAENSQKNFAKEYKEEGTYTTDIKTRDKIG